MARAIPLLAHLVVGLILATFGEFTAGLAASTSTAAHAAELRGADISWPNCPKGEGIPSRRSPGEPMPTRAARFVVVGVTNGPGFYPNPCLADQLTWVTHRHLKVGAYAMTTYPSAAQRSELKKAGPFSAAHRNGRLRNAGYAEAMYNLRVMHSVGLAPRLMWVDVEPYPAAPWSHSRSANHAVVQGVVRAYRGHGLRVGFYTYANGWRQVVGSWRLAHYPTWTTVGPRGRAAARRSCTRGPSGGRAWLAQWYTSTRDYDLVCPAGRHHLTRLFHPVGTAAG